jgi:HupE / UreJ protein
MRQLKSAVGSPGRWVIISPTVPARSAALALLVALCPVRASAHELSIDELRLWLPPAASELRGQLTFDPELTRSLDADLSDESKRSRIREFVEQQLSLDVNDRRCAPQWTVRELYERGGAAPGDVVMLTCPLPDDARLEVRVTAGRALPGLVVQGAGMTLAGSTAEGNERAVAGTGGAPAIATLESGDSVMFHLIPGPAPVGAPPGRPQPKTYLRLAAAFFARGVDHVLPSGLDHLLFVTAVTLGAHTKLRRLAVLLALFTLAHTLAVAWVAKGLWPPSPQFVEPCIAASIAVAGFATYRRVDSLHAVPLVVLFGLIHGLGFAGGLASLEPQLQPFLVSVVSFNLGVEAAHGAIVLVVLGLLYAARRRSLPVESATSWCALAITAVGAVWTALRLLPATGTHFT